MNLVRRTQSGFAAVAAAFLVVLVATIGAFVFSISHRESVVPDRTLLSSRAHIANRSALEWLLSRVTGPEQSGGTSANCVPATFAMDGHGLDGVSVAVNCSATRYSSGSTWVNTYYLTAQVSVGTPATRDYVERKLEAVVCRSEATPGGTSC